MSGRKSKRIRRTVRRVQKKLIVEFLDAVITWPFRDRLKMAWSIVRGKIK